MAIRNNDPIQKSARNRITRLGFLLLVVLLSLPCTWAARLTEQQQNWKDAEGNLVSFPSLQAFEEYLRTAEVIKEKRAPEGTTAPRKVLLSKDGIRMYACFRYVKVNQPQIRLASGKMAFNFRDDAIFEVAAYELSKLFGFMTVPPTVVRTIHDQEGTLQAWVPDTMMEKDRIRRSTVPPNAWRWAMEVQAVRLFDALIFNEDRNLGNLLIDTNWDLWMIDHTRAFRTHEDVPELEGLQAVERCVWEALSAIPDELIAARMQEFLAPGQIKALLERRTTIVQHLTRTIAEKGENRVLYRLLPVMPAAAATSPVSLSQ